MIDIHAHILPGVDDGSQSLSESYEMAEIARKSKVHTIVATPHCNMRGIFENYYYNGWEDQVEQLNKYLEERGNLVKIVPGMEIYGSNQVAKLIQEGLLISLNRSRYYLIEFPFDADPFWMGDILESILQLDKIPLIAHPERYYCIQDEPMILYEWMRQGCVTQLNKGSIFGRFGRYAQKTADLMLNYGLVTCVASDAHSSYQRTPFMSETESYLQSEFGINYTKDVLERNPEMILSNGDITEDRILRPERKVLVPFF